MPIEALDLSYYNDSGKMDEYIAELLSGCLDNCIYLTAKSQFSSSKIPYSTFFEDLTFRAIQQPREVRLLVNSIGAYDNWCRLVENKVTNDGKKAMNAVEDILNSGYYVIASTAINKIPTVNRYAPNMKAQFAAHAFVIIWHDKEFFYYVDHPNQSKNRNFQPYKMGSDVGKIRKEDIFEAFNHILVYRKIEFYADRVFNQVENVPFIITKSIENYYNNTEKISSQGNIVTFGRKAILRLNELCQENASNFPGYGIRPYEIARVGKRRNLLSKCLSEYKESNKVDFSNKIFTTARLSYERWLYVKDYVQQKRRTRSRIFNGEMRKLFEDLLEIEDRLFDELAGISKEISNS